MVVVVLVVWESWDFGGECAPLELGETPRVESHLDWGREEAVEKKSWIRPLRGSADAAPEVNG